jgi:hypothetical protein
MQPGRETGEGRGYEHPTDTPRGGARSPHRAGVCSPRPILGQSPVTAGANTNVTVQILAENATGTLYAMLHVDSGTPGEFGFPGPDGPVRVEGVVVAPPFNVTVPG